MLHSSTHGCKTANNNQPYYSNTMTLQQHHYSNTMPTQQQHNSMLWLQQSTRTTQHNTTQHNRTQQQQQDDNNTTRQQQHTWHNGNNTTHHDNSNSNSNNTAQHNTTTQHDWLRHNTTTTTWQHSKQEHARTCTRNGTGVVYLLGIVQLMGVAKGFERIIRKYGSEDCCWSHSSIWVGVVLLCCRSKAKIHQICVFERTFSPIFPKSEFGMTDECVLPRFFNSEMAVGVH